MSFDDQELIAEFVAESNEGLANVENQMLSIEAGGSEINVDLVNTVFRTIHSIKGVAGFLGLTTINNLSHSLENILNQMRNQELTPTSELVDIMLRAADTVRDLINNISESNNVDVSDLITKLDQSAKGGTNLAPAMTLEPVQQQHESPEATNEPQPAEPESPSEASAPSPTAQEQTVQATTPEALRQSEPKPVETNVSSAAKPEAPGSQLDSSIRVSVGVLDHLMNLAGELVLSRNQLLQAVVSDGKQGLDVVAAGIDQITSELQEAIMQTRLQPIGNIFSRFPRVVRDLSAKLGKQCDLTIDGKEVEVDKTIIEAMIDPLTHLIRNSADHGIELPAVRSASGKPEIGTIHLNAYHQAGKVRIDIEDDGAGIDPARLKEKAVSKGIATQEQADQMSDREAVYLIFHPGFSTAAQVSDISGRGVGMDVVRTNIEKLGGTIEVESAIGVGTNIQIMLPLTLAIIPSLIVNSGTERFAIPQVNISELVRIRPNEVAERLGHVKNAEVLRLRGNLLPLVRMDVTFGIAPEQPSQGLLKEGGLTGSASENPSFSAKKKNAAMSIIVVETGQTRYGLVVDGLQDSEEIVVKPLGRHLKDCRCLAGATILGDGHVALILDVAGTAAQAELGSGEDRENSAGDENSDFLASKDTQSILLFSNDPTEQFAIPMSVILRLERIRTEQIDSVGGQELLQYRGSSLPLLSLENHVSAKPRSEVDRVFVVVFDVGGHEVGLIAPHLADIRDVTTEVDTINFIEPGIVGSLVVDEKATRFLDLFELSEAAHPEWFVERSATLASTKVEGEKTTILLAEDSTFFRKQVSSFLESQGYEVIECLDGLEAWNTLQSFEHEFSLVITDIEMPNMNGFELCRRIKDTDGLSHLPVLALTSLTGDEDVKRGQDSGIDDYQVKMDREKLLASVSKFLKARRASRSQPSNPSESESLQPVESGA